MFFALQFEVFFQVSSQERVFEWVGEHASKWRVEQKVDLAPRSVEEVTEVLSDYAARFWPGYWIFVGPGSENSRKHDKKRTDTGTKKLCGFRSHMKNLVTQLLIIRQKARERAKTIFCQTTLLLRVALLLVVMDRRLGALEDRASFVEAVHDEDCNNKVRQVRESWRSQETERMDGAVAGQGDAQARGGNDAPGAWRHTLWVAPADCAAPDAARAGGACLPAQRGSNTTHTHTSRRSWHNRMTHWRRSSFVPDSPEIDAHGHGFLLLQTNTLQLHRIDWCLGKLMPVKCKKIFFAPLRSQDGPTVKFVPEWLDEQRTARGDDGGVDAPRQPWNCATDDQEALDAPKRKSR